MAALPPLGSIRPCTFEDFGNNGSVYDAEGFQKNEENKSFTDYVHVYCRCHYNQGICYKAADLQKNYTVNINEPTFHLSCPYCRYPLIESDIIPFSDRMKKMKFNILNWIDKNIGDYCLLVGSIIFCILSLIGKNYMGPMYHLFDTLFLAAFIFGCGLVIRFLSIILEIPTKRLGDIVCVSATAFAAHALVKDFLFL